MLDLLKGVDMKKSLFGVKKATSTIRATLPAIATTTSHGKNATTKLTKLG